MLKLAEERQRLDTLMRTFTKNNPEVIEQEKRISDLAQQAKARSGKTAEQENFDLSGNTLANSLYLDLIRLRREQEGVSAPASPSTWARGSRREPRST